MIVKGETTPGRLSDNRGFTLIETMIAITLLSVGILGLLAMQVTSTTTTFKARRMTQAAMQVSDRQEKLMARAYDDATLAPGSTSSMTDGKFTVDWDVSAVNVPIPNVKTVTITTSWTEKGQARSVQHVYYKADQF